jgi:response regulator RpfG family c-di-GMP phosphodiesterase
MKRRVLFVDDEPNVLEAYERGLRRQFHIDTALGAEPALAAIRTTGPYAVIVSDMRMPGMDGIQLLAKVKEIARDTVRIMLTGNSDQETAIEAVNEGNIFRFLTKPCDAERLSKALTAGIEQYRLVTAERELLENTLRGSIKVLTDVLSLVNPTAFGRASRVQSLVRRLATELHVEPSWELDIAAMLSQIGCVTLPADTMDKLYHGEKLTAEESQMLDAHPLIGRDLVANIPRLEGVAEIIACQGMRFDGTGAPPNSKKGAEIPLGARILKVALDFDTLKSRGLTEIEAVLRLRAQRGAHDPQALAALEAINNVREFHEIREIGLRDLLGGMVFADDVQTVGGLLLVCKGQEANPPLCDRLKNYARHARIREPIRVVVRSERATAASSEPQRHAHGQELNR